MPPYTVSRFKANLSRGGETFLSPNARSRIFREYINESVPIVLTQFIIQCQTPTSGFYNVELLFNGTTILNETAWLGGFLTYLALPFWKIESQGFLEAFITETAGNAPYTGARVEGFYESIA